MRKTKVETKSPLHQSTYLLRLLFALQMSATTPNTVFVAPTQQVSPPTQTLPPPPPAVPQTVLYQPTKLSRSVVAPLLPVAVTDPSLIILQEGLCAKTSVYNHKCYLDLRKFFRATKNNQPVLAPGTSAQIIIFSKKGISLQTDTWQEIIPTLQKMIQEQTPAN